MIDAASTPDNRTQEAFQLALETSGDIGGVAIGRAGALLGVQCLSAAKKHTAELLPTIEALCRKHGARPADIAEVFVSVGPGSFTGLRIGVAAARAIALGVAARTIGVGTLEVIAQNALTVAEPPERVAVMLDAGRGHVFASTFHLKDARYVPETIPVEADPAAYLTGLPCGCGVLGTRLAASLDVPQVASLRVLDESLAAPQAQTVYSLGIERARRGSFDDPKNLVPHYVRVPYAEEKRKLATRPER